MKFMFKTLFFLIAFTCGAFAADIREVVLTDGSVIRGEVLQFDSSGCKIKNDTFGIIKVPMNKVDEIRHPRAASGVPAAQTTGQQKLLLSELQKKNQKDAIQAQVGVIQQLLMQDPKMQQLVMALQTDPDIMKALQDPKIMMAIQTGDYKSLEKHPAIIKLMSKPEIKKLGESVGR